MTPPEIVAVLTPTFAFLGTCFTGYMALKMAQFNAVQRQRAEEAKASEARLSRRLRRSTWTSQAKMDNLAEVVADSNASATKERAAAAVVAKATHALVNSGMMQKLRLIVEMARELDEVKNTPESAKILADSIRILEIHERSQAVVDAQPGTDAEKRGD